MPVREKMHLWICWLLSDRTRDANVRSHDILIRWLDDTLRGILDQGFAYVADVDIERRLDSRIKSDAAGVFSATCGAGAQKDIATRHPIDGKTEQGSIGVIVTHKRDFNGMPFAPAQTASSQRNSKSEQTDAEHSECHERYCRARSRVLTHRTTSLPRWK